VTSLRSEPQTPRANEARAANAPRERADARLGDEARAARHLAAAGDADAAIERYFQAVQKAAAAAAYPQAVAHANAALALLDRLPPSEARRLQRVQFLLEAGRVLWHGAGPDESFTLHGALRVLESARASLRSGDPAELVAEVAAVIAGILYDLGDVESLARAEGELSNASRALSQADLPRAAARLFNDQASIYMRLGDHVRAAHLLTESRKIFEAAGRTDPIAMIEMAETDHLFAQILLHVPARPGREQDALSLGLDHAIAAERAFRRLGAPREVGRVLETMGRIELRKGRLGRAADHLTAAVKLQESVGDLVGLARSTATLSEVMAAGGQIREAVSLLADSMVLNYEKGSPLGLALNRRALAALAREDRAHQADDLLQEVAGRLALFEQKLGRIEIPGSAGTAD
jgi:tetratricopeptide (TPR) repeat protein